MSEKTRTLRTLLARLFALPLVAAAQYPSKPIRLIVPFPPGGAAELGARAAPSPKPASSPSKRGIFHGAASPTARMCALRLATPSCSLTIARDGPIDLSPGQAGVDARMRSVVRAPRALGRGRSILWLVQVIRRTCRASCRLCFGPAIRSFWLAPAANQDEGPPDTTFAVLSWTLIVLVSSLLIFIVAGPLLRNPTVDGVLSHWRESYYVPTVYLALAFAFGLGLRWIWQDYRETGDPWNLLRMLFYLVFAIIFFICFLLVSGQAIFGIA